MAPALGVYVHWPYCARVCPYCDFNVYRHRGRSDAQAALVEAILTDLSAQQAATAAHRLTSIYFGGGTPSLMAPVDVDWIIRACRALWPAASALEITLEANPTDADSARFEAFAKAGVNRLSLGLQSLDDAALKILGRNHGAEEARGAARLARRIFPQLSVDLIYALPGQTVEDWREALKHTVEALSPDHLSPYQLTIEPGTAFERAARRGRLASPKEDACADLFEATQTVLGALGFDAYEVSNHARGICAQSRHNLTYWRGEAYVGVGPGAHGRLFTDQGWAATEAALRPADYAALVARQGLGHPPPTVLSPKQRAEERVIMGLRTTEGVALSELAPLRLDADAGVVQDLAALELLMIHEQRLVATEAGRRILNAVTRRLVTEASGLGDQALVSSSPPRLSDGAAP
jgi:putative oxygen-independent coproporphyrinogen III oxidase